MSKINFDYVNTSEQISPTKFNNNFKKIEDAVNDGSIGSGSTGPSGITGVEYGVEWDVTNHTFTRLKSAVGMTKGADFNSAYPWSGMKRCNLTDAGVVTAYFGDTDFKGDGTNGQVMVEIPKFYYKTVPVAYTMVNKQVVPSKLQYYVCDAKLDGYKLHPAFLRDGEELDYVYLGAFEAVAFDASAGNYVNDFAFDAAADMLGSVSGFKPISGKHTTFTRATARSMARRRGAGWEIQDFLTTCAVQMLILIELASFDVQTEIGQGIVNKTDDGSNNMAENTGYTSSMGSTSGEVATSSTTHKAVNYRGIENFWGNIWIWVDGVNIQNSGYGYLWIADHGFADDIMTEPYHRVNGQIPGSNGYVDKFIYDGTFDFMFVASSVAGASNQPPNDYFWQNRASTSMTVALLGAHWYYGLHAGAFCWGVSHASSSSDRGIGSRLGFYRRTTHRQKAAA